MISRHARPPRRPPPPPPPLPPPPAGAAPQSRARPPREVDDAQRWMPAVAVLGVANAEERLVAREPTYPRALPVGVEQIRGFAMTRQVDRVSRLGRCAEHHKRPRDRQPGTVRRPDLGRDGFARAALKRLDDPATKLTPPIIVEPTNPPPLRIELPAQRPRGSVGHLPVRLSAPVPGVDLPLSTGIGGVDQAPRVIPRPTRQSGARGAETPTPGGFAHSDRAVRGGNAARSRSSHPCAAATSSRDGRCAPYRTVS